jgi:hypothetical protein
MEHIAWLSNQCHATIAANPDMKADLCEKYYNTNRKGEKAMVMFPYLMSQYRGASCTSKSVRWLSIDDRDDYDVCSRSFCHIAVSVPHLDSDTFDLTLTSVPWDKDVENVVREIGGVWSDTVRQDGRNLTISLHYKDATKVRKLARAIRKVTGRGKSYIDSNWKWVARRTSGSLDQFADCLREYARMRRTGQVCSSGNVKTECTTSQRVSKRQPVSDDLPEDIFVRLALAGSNSDQA